jgi:hypothetical protein
LKECLQLTAGSYQMERSYTERLACSESTKELIMVYCVEEYLEHHPEAKDFRISADFILKKLAEYYLE